MEMDENSNVIQFTNSEELENRHRQEHIKLHQAMDRLLADYVIHGAKGPVLHRTIGELLEWSFRQTEKPDHSF